MRCSLRSRGDWVLQVAYRVYSECNRPSRPSLHTEFTRRAMAFSLAPFRLPCSTCVLSRVLAPLPFPRVHSDLDHCSLGTRIPPHSEASGDPETRILGLALTNRCSTPRQPSSPLGDQTSMSHAELARNAAHSLPLGAEGVLPRG